MAEAFIEKLEKEEEKKEEKKEKENEEENEKEKNEKNIVLDKTKMETKNKKESCCIKKKSHSQLNHDLNQNKKLENEEKKENISK